MKRVFADTAYWVALLNPGDSLHETARRAEQALVATPIVTTEEILVEFLNFFSGSGAYFRAASSRTAEAILQSPRFQVVPQSHPSFTDGMSRYRRRLDKNYSLTDCISMNAMDTLKIHHALTSDRHFEQEGFEILLK